MKKYITAALSLFLVAVNSFAQLPTSGVWEGLNSGDLSRRVNTQTVNLTGDIRLKCTIVVGNGKTLTINGSGYQIYNIVGTDSRSAGMFMVEKGGKLIINGASGARITLGGGGNYADPSPSYNEIMSGGIIDKANALVTAAGSTTIEMGAPAIINQGEVELNWTIIQNVCNTYYSADSGTCTQNISGGAIVHGTTATSTKMTNCIVKRILAQTGAGVFAVSGSNGKIEITDTQFTNCINYTRNAGLHGGVVRGWGNSGADITLTRVNINHCYSAADGGAMYFPSNGTNTTTGKKAVLTLNGCQFYNNCAELRSGALDICANLEFKTAVTKVHHNYVKDQGTGGGIDGIGGGISFRAYDSTAPAAGRVDVVYNANDFLEVYENKSYRGGGIAFYASNSITLEPTSTFTLNLNGAKIHDNEGSGYGGGIWMRNDNNETNGKGYTFTLNLNRGEIYSNKSGYGGGIYVNKWDVKSSSDGTIEIYSNASSDAGGAMYLQNSTYVMNSGIIGGSDARKNTAGTSAGGIYVNHESAFTFNDGEVSYNTSDTSGGGVMISNSSTATFNGGYIKNNHAGTVGGGVAVLYGSTFTFNSTGSVSGNTATDSGGGLYCNNASIDFKKGDCCGNIAVNAGGGVVCLNEGTITFTGNIQNNEAQRGGGIALNTGASFTMKGGIISGNKAETDSVAPKTTYNARNDGFGGGVFLYNYDPISHLPSSSTTTLTIDVSDESPFGLYGNIASLGGNDIATCGEGTSVTIPNVKSMELAGFEYRDAVPNWYEDYNAGDANYALGTNLDLATNARYADQLTANTYMKHLVSFSGYSHTYSDTYLNLTLGYELLHIILSAKNLLNGDTAMFKLTYTAGTSTEKSWIVVLTGNGSESVSKTLRNLNYGHYKVEYVPIRSEYDVVSPVTKIYDGDVSIGPEKEYQFILTRRNKDVKTGEDQVVNIMRPSKSTYLSPAPDFNDYDDKGNKNITF